MIVVGALSGTSVDGIDVVVAKISHEQRQQLDHQSLVEDGEKPQEDVEVEYSLTQLYFATQPWKPEDRELILSLCRKDSGLTVQDICNANFRIGKRFGEAIQDVISKSGVQPNSIDVIGSHGQTIWHEVVNESGKLSVLSTLQIGEPSCIAATTGITTVADFRVRDVAEGGCGAPLISTFDMLLLRPKSSNGWRAVQNIGGIGNVTFLPSKSQRNAIPMAFDTGPGNVLIDWATGIFTKGTKLYDDGGKIAESGKANYKLVEEMLKDDYFLKSPPKTTGRELFHATYASMWRSRAVELTGSDISDVDFIATLTEFTAASIADSYAKFSPGKIEEAIIRFGSHNAFLMKRIEAQLESRLGYHVAVSTHESLGIDSDAKAYNCLHGLPGNVPQCTGAKGEVILGKIVPGANFRSVLLKTQK